jgi:hypothetical protein
MPQTSAERVAAHRARQAQEKQLIELATLLATNESDRRREGKLERERRLGKAIAYQRNYLRDFGVLAHP